MWTSFLNSISCLFEKYKILKFLMFFMILGSVLGSLFANIFISETNSSILSSFIRNFFTDYSANILENNYSFTSAFLKNIKFFAIIWILGFTSIGCFFTILIVFLKGISYGFTMAFFIIEFGFLGVFYACSFYLLQNIILVPCYFYLSINSFTYSSKRLYIRKNPCYLRKYLLIFLYTCLLVAFISFLDVFISPKIIAIFI